MFNIEYTLLAIWISSPQVWRLDHQLGEALKWLASSEEYPSLQQDLPETGLSEVGISIFDMRIAGNDLD